MSTVGHEGVGGESLNIDELLTAFDSTRECFPLVAGTVGARGETEVVNVPNYHAPIHELMDIPTHLAHIRATIGAPSIGLPLEISDTFKYAFDYGDTWFRVGRGAFLHFPDRHVPVRLVSVEYNDGSHLHWIYNDEPPVANQ